MRIAGIVHQQICQLRWHILACMGLLMLLPIEEALVNLRSGGGFYSVSLAVAAVTFGPLLAGLIACANVQADLDQKRYIFWRSKPANVKLLMTLKFFVGLIVSLIVLACPIVFAIATVLLFAKERVEREPMYSMPFLVLIAVMTYSLCFACNVLVRKSARAWLIGMLLAGLLLVLPFVLPLNYKDLVTDTLRWTLSAYLAIVLGASAAAFVFSLYATQHDWHLKTNLKGLLWVGAGLLFVLMMLFSSQVANIKVLREREIGAVGWTDLGYLENRVVLQGGSYVDVSGNRISLSPVGADPNTGWAHLARWEGPYGREGYIAQVYPSGGIYKEAGNDVYSLAVHAYFRREESSRYYEKVYIRTYKFGPEPQPPASELDISDCLTDGINMLRVAARLIDNTLVVCVNDSCIVVDATDPGKLKQIDKKLNVLDKSTFLEYEDRERSFAVPLVPVDNINMEERIRLSIDLRYRFHYGENDIYETSIVDVHDSKIAFFSATQQDIARFDVIGWDDEKVHCKFSVARPFTILEGMVHTFGPHSCVFVRDQKLYAKEDEQLMVFDVRSERTIRKLGHFVRMDWKIEDIAVFESGKILLCTHWSEPSEKPRHRERRYLCLLENPA